MRSLLKLAPTLALPLALSLTACAGDDSASASDTQTSDATATATATGSASDSSSESDSETGDVDTKTQLCGTGDKTEGSGTNLMEKWGTPCSSNEECVAVAGEGSECIENILDIYVLPQGYCTKPCSLPDSDTQYVENDPMCGDEGMTCLGAVGFFETCALPCTSDDECQRDGYSCQVIPQLGAEGDPKFCLMNYQCTVACIDDPSMAGCS